MGYKIIVTPDALSNLDHAIDYYTSVTSIKVAKSFIKDFKETYKAIVKAKYFQIYFENFRGKPMKKFPFIVFYTIEEDLKTIVIKAVFHTSQNPDKYFNI